MSDRFDHDKSAHHFAEKAVLADDQTSLPPVSITGGTDAAKVTSIIAGLVSLGLATDDTT
jgi:hypothetical protein